MHLYIQHTIQVDNMKVTFDMNGANIVKPLILQPGSKVYINRKTSCHTHSYNFIAVNSDKVHPPVNESLGAS